MRPKLEEKIEERNPPYRLLITTYLRNTETNLRYTGEGHVELPFPPFSGLVIKLKGGFRVPFKGTTKVEWDGRDFHVETITFNVKTPEQERAHLDMLAEAGFQVWWPYDRKAHIQRIAKNHVLRIVQ